MFIINSESNYSQLKLFLIRQKNLRQKLKKKISLIIKNTNPRYHQAPEGIGSSLVVVCGF